MRIRKVEVRTIRVSLTDQVIFEQRLKECIRVSQENMGEECTGKRRQSSQGVCGGCTEIMALVETVLIPAKCSLSSRVPPSFTSIESYFSTTQIAMILPS